MVRMDGRTRCAWTHHAQIMSMDRGIELSTPDTGKKL